MTDSNVLEFPLVPITAADVDFRAGVHHELDEMWRTRKTKPLTFRSAEYQMEARQQIEELLNRYDAVIAARSEPVKKPDEPTPEPEPQRPWPMPHWVNPNQHEASVETSQYPNLDKLFRS